MAHVVSASLGASGPLLLKLTGLLAGEYGRLKGVRREILALRCELASMHAAVQKYSMIENPDVQVKEWISMVRELAYDIEDCIDKFIHRLGNGGRHGGFKEFFRKTARHLKALGSRRGIADQIDELKTRIKQVKELKNSYRLDDIASSTSSHSAVDPRLCALFVEEGQLVGVDGPRDDLTKWMMEDGNKNRKVLSIVGFGGLGKTTLANEVYGRIQGYFNCLAFVSVSQKPNLNKIIKDLIYKLPRPDGFTKDIDMWDELASIRQLRALLQDTRYLIIIDDLWSTKAWNTIKCAFPENNLASRIIVTTRIIDVAKSCSPGRDHRVYEMEALSDLHSKRLFFKRIFGSENYCPDMVKEVSEKILKKCGGLPLAIISVSGLLANKPATKEEWEKITRSIGHAMDRNQSLDGISSILSLSYNDLLPSLKTCLLYLSIFPEDSVIERDVLVRRWIAEGFISEERGYSQQEVAEKHFYELINKSMVQPLYIGYDGKVSACRVHDMMLEIIISKSVEDNFITVLGGGQISLARSHGFIRRLSIQYIDQELAFTLENEDLSHVRSLTVTPSGGIKHLPSLVRFEALRVLDFDDCKGLDEYNMNGMDKLFNLRYLSLRGTGISKLPPGIVMLRDLQTLDLRNTSVQELPDGFVQLAKLEHLLAAGDTKIPKGIGDMKSLRVISGFSVTQSLANAVENLGNLANLDLLDVYFDGGGSNEYKRHEEMLLSSLCRLSSCKLQSLEITRYGGSLEFLDNWSPVPSSLQIFYMSSDYYFPNVPNWIAPVLTSLAYLDLNLNELTEEGLHTLGELPALLRLELLIKVKPIDRVKVQGIGFPSLKEFVLRCTDGAYVTFVKGAMPNLQSLEVPCLLSVAKTYAFYLGIGHLPSLKKATIRFYNAGATSSESKSSADAVTNEAGTHSNHPAISFQFWEPDEEDDEESDNEETKSSEDSEN